MLVPVGRIFSCTALLAALLATLAVPTSAQTTTDRPKFRKLTSQLSQLAQEVDPSDTRASVSTRGRISALGLNDLDDGRVGITIRFDGPVEPIREFILSRGGHVAYEFEGVIEAFLSPQSFADIDALKGVLKVRATPSAHPKVTSQGVQVHNAVPWQQAGYSGQGVKVGIIDGGFYGYSSLPSTDKPTVAAVRCYYGNGTYSSLLSACESGDSHHGTAVAEAVHDIAPNAVLYLARTNSPAEFYLATEWLVQQGVKVINASLSYAWDGPGDGTSPYWNSPLRAVDLAAANGALMTIAAGNEGKSGWYGPWADTDNDGYLNFSPSSDSTCTLNLAAGQHMRVQVRWQDSWVAANRDLDLELWHWASNTTVAVSNDWQTGVVGDEPSEVASFVAPSTGTYCASVKRRSGTMPQWVQLIVLNSLDLDLYTTAGTIGNPAETANPGALAVGAANWSTPSSIETFSSAGPTPDGRVKPDIVGVDNADAVTYPTGFSGTSQAAPHVAGLAAVVASGYPSDTLAQLTNRLKNWALPRGAVPNNTWGYGLAYLPSVYNVAVTKLGAGAGTVTSSDGGVNCGASCVRTYFAGDLVTLTAVASAGSAFTGWSGGGCSGTGHCVVSVAAATTVTATFSTVSSLQLTVNKTGTGSGTVTSTSPSGTINCGSFCSASFSQGTSVTLAATAAVGSVFTGWSGACSGTSSCTVTMTEARAVTANFALLRTLTVTRAGSGSGTVASTPGGISCGSGCAASFASGTAVTLTATPAVGSTFLGWSGDVCTGTGACSVVMNVPLSVTATFAATTAGTRSYYLAEGSTSGLFDLDVLVANPSSQTAPVKLTFLTGTGSVETLTDSLPPTSRRTYRIGRSHMPTLASEGGISTVVESTAGIPLIVERTMFWNKETWYAGHGGTAVARPETKWYFGEGAQGFFDTFVLLANASDTPAQVTVTFLLDDPSAAPFTVPITVDAKRRETVWALAYPELTNRSFSIVVESDVPIIAERAMYHGQRFVWQGGHESAGVPALSTQWFHAEGATGDLFDEYILVGNPNDADTTVTFTFLLDSGAPVVGTKVVGRQSRFTLNVEAAGLLLDGISQADDQRLKAAAISVRVESTLPVVSERAMYWPGNFTTWAEAHNSFGVTETGVKWGLAEGRNGGTMAFDTYILIANPSPQNATIRATFLRPDGPTTFLDRTVSANSRFNIFPHEMPTGEFGVVIESTNGVPIVVERAMYWTPAGRQHWEGGTNALATKLQ